MKTSITKSQYAVCVRNDECEDLEIRKIYHILPDKRAAKDGYVRVVDESGEDYLYPDVYFVMIELPDAAQWEVAASAEKK